MRTAAVSAVALEALAPALFPNGPVSLGILGSGVQARSHLKALRMVCPTLGDIRIWSRTPANAEALAAEVIEAGASARVVPVEEAAEADVVLTATLSPSPVLEGRWLAQRAIVIAVGAVGGGMRELDDEVMRSSWVVAECRQAAVRESGDVALSGATVQAEVGEILAHSPAYPLPRDGRILFKSLGMAIEDLTAARLVWQARNGGPA
jgi:thiomorpholine-carboxylate dehydrogenase